MPTEPRHGQSGGPSAHRPLADLGDALVFPAEIEFAMRHAPIKQHDRTPEEQEAVERYTTYWAWLRDVLRQHGYFTESVTDA